MEIKCIKSTARLLDRVWVNKEGLDHFKEALYLTFLFMQEFYTGAKKYSHPYYINTIEMRSLWMGIEYLKIPTRFFDRD